jgi:hypothetical protein
MLAKTSVTPSAGLTPFIAMLKPCCASCCTMPNPIPLLPPVTKATLAICIFYVYDFYLMVENPEGVK